MRHSAQCKKRRLEEGMVPGYRRESDRRETRPRHKIRAKKKAREKSGALDVVERMRIELTTSALRTRRSPS